jgi:glycosyltransferase involved in cell wall biosynthesis
MVPDPLKLVSPSKFRLYNQQVSDFLHCEQGWESYVDLLAPLSHSHAQYMRPQTSLSHDKWRVMYNGVDPEQFAPGKKESGKIVWASSHDRGLHWLLEAWPHIRAGAPHANLHIFYDFSGVQAFATIEGQSNTVRDKQLNELGQRSRYILECLRRFTPEQHGVHVHRSVSRNRMQQEMASAEVLAYPLDPVHYTETFGVTVLEACAAGVIPVLCTNDCFGELWGSVAETVPPPYSQHKGEFVAKVVGILNDADTRIAKSSQCVMYARRFAWDLLAKDLEATLTTRGMEGLPHPNWS